MHIAKLKLLAPLQSASQKIQVKIKVSKEESKRDLKALFSVY